MVRGQAAGGQEQPRRHAEVLQPAPQLKAITPSPPPPPLSPEPPPPQSGGGGDVLRVRRSSLGGSSSNAIGNTKQDQQVIHDLGNEVEKLQQGGMGTGTTTDKKRFDAASSPVLLGRQSLRGRSVSGDSRESGALEMMPLSPPPLLTADGNESAAEVSGHHSGPRVGEGGDEHGQSFRNGRRISSGAGSYGTDIGAGSSRSVSNNSSGTHHSVADRGGESFADRQIEDSYREDVNSSGNGRANDSGASSSGNGRALNGASSCGASSGAVGGGGVSSTGDAASGKSGASAARNSPNERTPLIQPDIRTR
jgi:hypothetical protein